MEQNNSDLVKPIFIFGCSNSGTKILWQALKNHKDLSGPDVEGQDLEELPETMKHSLGKATFRLWAHPKFKLKYYYTEKDYNEEDKEKIKKVYSKYLIPGTRFITKSPADTLRARLIQSYFPDAYFIAVVRNGYAVSEGIIRKRKDDPERQEFKGLFTTIDESAEQWFRANTIIVSHKEFLKNYMIIKYEDLVEKPDETVSAVINFLGLNKEGFIIPEYIKGLNEIQISRLSPYDIETVTRIAQPMLIHFGYQILQKDLDWENVKHHEIY
ncbi:MAG: sulfotransferase [Candidatus Pacearchaeota archaeon]|jgi:hypothetical protein